MRSVLAAFIFVFILVLVSGSALADYQEQPKHCLKQLKNPCAIWTFKKTHLPRAGMQIFASADALFEISENSIYQIRGMLWVVSDKSVTVESRFGSVKSEGNGEIWTQADDQSFVVRSLANTLIVLPRGDTQGTDLGPGFETRLSYINRNLRMADTSWATPINLVVHLREFNSVVPNAEVFKQKAGSYAGVVLVAAQQAAKDLKKIVDRHVANAQTPGGPKYVDPAMGGRDSYLRKLFRQKNNFAE